MNLSVGDLKERITPRKVLITFKEYVVMTLGMALYAFGWIGCILPAKSMGAGAAGLALLIYHLTGIPMGISVLCINGILLLIAGFIVGWNFGIKTIFCICMMSLWLSIWQGVFPEGWSLLTFLADASNPEPLFLRLLSAILGGIITGIGIAICFHEGGSTGGTDIVSIIINKYRTISYGRIVMIVDFFVIGSAIFVKDLGIDAVIFGYIIIAVLSYTVDYIQSGNMQSNQIMIFSRDHYSEIADTITSRTHRGATLLDSKGWYTKEEGYVVLVVCRKRETTQMLKIVRAIDPAAFISVGSVMGVYGKGFEPLKKL
ncbi:MAG: YitT family protein [Alistipes sp.]|nr:YitT family protein [Alistipes sp.]